MRTFFKWLLKVIKKKPHATWPNQSKTSVIWFTWLSRVCHWFRPYFQYALATGFMFSRVYMLPVPVPCFPALATGSTFSRKCHWFHVFPCLHATSSMFSRAFHRFHIFPRLPSVTSSDWSIFLFSASVIGYLISLVSKYKTVQKQMKRRTCQKRFLSSSGKFHSVYLDNSRKKRMTCS